MGARRKSPLEKVTGRRKTLVGRSRRTLFSNGSPLKMRRAIVQDLRGTLKITIDRPLPMRQLHTARHRIRCRVSCHLVL